MLAVIVLHVSGGWLESLPVGTTDWHALNMWDSLCRWCVPVFVMCSGMFLLDPQKALSWPSLFLRYILRMVTALLFWGAAYRLLYELAAGTLSPASLPRALYAVILGNTETHPVVSHHDDRPLSPHPSAARLCPRGQAERFPLVLSGVRPLHAGHPPFPPSPWEPDRRPLCQPALSQFYPGLSAPGLCGVLSGGLLSEDLYPGPPGRGAHLRAGHRRRGLYRAGHLPPLPARRRSGRHALQLSHAQRLRHGGGRLCPLPVCAGPERRALPQAAGRPAGRMRLRRLSLPCDLSGVAAPFWAGHAAIPTAVAVPLLTLVIFLPSFLLSWLIHKIPVVGRYLT